MTPAATRIHVLLAREAPVGVIIRRGPHRQAHLLLWDTRTDAVTPGQWLKQRVYSLRCDLSPDGKRLSYFVLDGQHGTPTGGTYTAVSRPPYFTALALWPKGDTWHGGGLFVNDHTLWLNGPHREPIVGPPQRLRVTQFCPHAEETGTEDLGIYGPRLKRDGWVPQEPQEVDGVWSRTWVKQQRRLELRKRTYATLREDVAKGRGVYFDEHELFDGTSGSVLPLAGAEWADFDQAGRLVYAANGQLRAGDVVGGRVVERVIADLNGMTFQAVPPPTWALRW